MSRKRGLMDTSSDDFVTPPVIKKTVSRVALKSVDDNNSETTTSTKTRISKQSNKFVEDAPNSPSDIGSSYLTQILPDCPFCSKAFNPSQEQQRSSHLKSCAKSKGVGAKQLIEIQRLEQRQAKERRALGLKQVQTCTVVTTRKDANDQSQKKTRSNTRRRNPAASVATNDPHLEMALALSASLADAEAADEVASLGPVVDEDSKKAILSSMQTDVLLPSSSTWGCLRSDRSAQAIARGSRKAKTALQVRTDEERSKQIGLKVEQILAIECAKMEELEVAQEPSLRLREALNSESLRRCEDPKARNWHMSQLLTNENKCFKSSIIDKITNSLDDTEPRCLDIAEKEETVGNTSERVKSTYQNGTSDAERHESSKFLEELSKSFEAFWRRRVDTDLVIYARNDRTVECHSQILKARCKPLLNDVIVEQNEEGSKVPKLMLCRPDVTVEALDLFLKFVYGGKVGELELRSTFDGLLKLAEEAKLASLTNFLKRKMKREALIDDTDDIDEWERSRNGPDQLEDQKEDDGTSDDKTSRNEDTSLNLSQLETEVVSSPVKSKSFIDVTRNDCNESSRVASINHGQKDSVLKGPRNCVSSDRIISGDQNQDPFEDGEDSFLRETTLGASVPSPAYLGDVVYAKPPENPCDSSDIVNDNHEMDLVPSPPYLGEESVIDNVPNNVLNGSRSPASSVSPVKPSRTPCSSTPQKSRTPDLCTSQKASTGFETPRCRGRSLSRSKSAVEVTPMPDYDNLLTPELRRELHRFGLKAIPRAKAVPFLKHIYEQTHPECVTDEDPGSSALESSFEECAEESIANATLHGDDLEPEVDLRTRVNDYIKADRSLHTRVLLYEPFWLEDFHAAFKSKTGSKARLGEVTDILDSLGVTFRTRARSRRREPEKKRKTKKKI